MFTENTLDQNLISVIGDVEQPHEQVASIGVMPTCGCPTCYVTCVHC